MFTSVFLIHPRRVVALGMVSPSIDSQMRVIRNIQIIRQDLEPLLPTRNQEIPGTPINAYGTVVQDVQWRESGPCFLSSRIPILLDHENTPGSVGHTELNEHIHAAVRQSPTRMKAGCSRSTRVVPS